MRKTLGVIGLVIALLLAVISLAISGFLLYGLAQFREAGLASVVEAREAVAGLSDHRIETTIPFQQTFPIHTTVPLQEEFVVPIQTTIPISTVVQVPLQIPVLGTYSVRVPVVTDVPVNLEIAVPVSRTVEVDLEVNVDTEVPLVLEVSQLGLDALLQQIDAALTQLERGLRWPQQ